MATGEDHPDIADVPRMHLRAIRMFFGLEKGGGLHGEAYRGCIQPFPYKQGFIFSP